MSKTEKLLSELIALPSVNPAFLPVGDRHAGEQRVADFLADRAAKLGLDVEFKSVCPDRSNLLVRLLPSQKVKQRILLAPHLDTVGGSDVPGQLFTPRITKGRLYGRGACDTKGSVAVMFAALCELSSAHRPSQTEIIFAGLVDEESVQAGSRTLMQSGLKAQLAIVGEPTRLQVVTAHKGVLWLKLETRGKAAHGARPELGRNAVHAMARIVDLLETRYAAQLRRRRPHPLLGHGSVNVGFIQGGRQPNIVPAECFSSIDRRTLPGETDAQVMQEIRQMLERANLGANMKRTQTAPCFPLETDPGLPLVRQFLHLARQRKPAGVDFFSDAGVLSHGGIPSVVFGPGDIAQAHTADEWISLPQLERGKNMLVQFLQSLP